MVFDLLASVEAVLEGAWDCDEVAGSEGFPRLPNAFEAEAEGPPEVGDDILVVLGGLSCGLPWLGKKLVFGAFVDWADAPLLDAALLVARLPNKVVLGAVVGDFTVPLEVAA